MNCVLAAALTGGDHLLEAIGVFAIIVQQAAPGCEIVKMVVIGSGLLGENAGKR